MRAHHRTRAANPRRLRIANRPAESLRSSYERKRRLHNPLCLTQKEKERLLIPLLHPKQRMSAAFDFSALSPPFLRNLVDAHIFPPISEWTDSSLNRVEQLYAKKLAEVRDTLKDSDKQSSHVLKQPARPRFILALKQLLR
jgi:hypothetical protein